MARFKEADERLLNKMICMNCYGGMPPRQPGAENADMITSAQRRRKAGRPRSSDPIPSILVLRFLKILISNQTRSSSDTRISF